MSRADRLRPLLAPLILAATAVVAPGRATAQSLEFTPYAGAVFPLGKLFERGTSSLSHRTHVAFGARMDAWLTRSMGFELAVGYAPSGYHWVDSLGTVVDTTGGLFQASGRLLYRFARAGRVSAIALVGAGMVKHGGQFVDPVTGKTNLAAVAGIAGRLDVTAGWSLLLSAEDYAYSARLGGAQELLGASSRLNNDVVVSFGLVMQGGRHPRH